MKTTPLMLAALVAAWIAAPAVAQAERAKSLFAFDDASGYAPEAGVIAAPDGTVLGTTVIGGNGPCVAGAGCGTVYALLPPAPGGNWIPTVLYNFQGGQDGGFPQAMLSIDDAGAIYGYSSAGTPGSVFQLSPPQRGRRDWTFKLLYVFTGQGDGDLEGVYSPLILHGGDLYGIASGGGSVKCGQFGCGSVFRLVPNSGGGAWSEETLYSFTGGADGGLPTWIAGFDSAGAVYVSTALGNGAVARIAPPVSGNAWTEDILTRFKDGGNVHNPTNLILAPNGNLYGIADRPRGGFAFQLAPPTGGGTKWTRTTIADIKEHRYGPVSLAPDAGGALIGTIEGDFDFFAGSVFRLTPPPGGGGAWTYTMLWNFNRGPDRNPLNVVPGRKGHLFGVLNGGDSSSGSLFELH